MSKSSGASAIVAGVLLAATGVIGTPVALAAKADPLVAAFTGLFLVIGVVVILTARRQVITLTNPGASTIVSTRLIGGGTKTESFDASQVAGVQVESRIDQTGASGTPTNPRRRTTLSLMLTDGTRHILASEQKNQNSFTLNGIGATNTLPLSDEGQRIANLFNVQFFSKDNSFGDNPVQSIADGMALMRQAMEEQKAKSASYEQPAAYPPEDPTAPPRQ